jgi:hypothetical protein
MGMKTVPACEQHAVLVEEYKLALHRLANARAAADPRDPQTKRSLTEATRSVELLEEQLRQHRLVHGC